MDGNDYLLFTDITDEDGTVTIANTGNGTGTDVSVVDATNISDAISALDNNHYSSLAEEARFYNFIQDTLKINPIYGQERGVCTSCNFTNDLICEYTRNNFTRKICRDCAITAIDKFFGINSKVETEKLLYGNNP